MDKSQLNLLFDPLLFARLVKVYNIEKFFILFYVIIFFLRMARNCLCDLFIVRNTYFFYLNVLFHRELMRLLNSVMHLWSWIY